MKDEDVVIVSAARTPVGSFNGSLASVPAHTLGEVAIRAALDRAHVPPADVDFVVIDVPSALEETVPLGSAVSAVKGQPAQIAIYRRPVEIRSKGRDERALLIHEVVVEQVAELLGLAPESVDPRYGQD